MLTVPPDDRAAVEAIYKTTAQIFLAHGAVDPPFAEFHTAAGIVTVPSDPIFSDEDKQTFVNLIRSYSIITRAERVVVAAKAWASPSPNQKVRPSLEPNRTEGVFFVCETATGRTTAMAPIRRNVFPHLGPLQNLAHEPPSHGGGLFSRLVLPDEEVDGEAFATALAYLDLSGHIDLSGAATAIGKTGLHQVRLPRMI